MLETVQAALNLVNAVGDDFKEARDDPRIDNDLLLEHAELLQDARVLFAGLNALLAKRYNRGIDKR